MNNYTRILFDGKSSKKCMMLNWNIIFIIFHKKLTFIIVIYN